MPPIIGFLFLKQKQNIIHNANVKNKIVSIDMRRQIEFR